MPLKKPSPGDDLLRLAQKEGVGVAAIRAHPENRELFACREPGVLSSEEELFIPPPEPKKEQISTGETHYIVYRPATRFLHFVLHDESAAPRQADYTLSDFVFDGPKPKYGFPWPDELHGYAYQGVVHEELPATVTKLKLVLDDDEDNALTIELGRLEPVGSTRGLKARLRSLGLYPGDVASSDYGVDLTEAVRLFQARQGLRVTGKADLATRAKLKTVCGG